MKSITIGFSKPKTFKLHAWLIMKIDNASFDHAYLKFHSDNLNRDIIYQAVGKGVQFIGNSLFILNSEPISEFQLEVDDEKYISLMQFCLDNAGISYGFWQVLALGIVRILSKINININNSLQDKLKTEFCSEIVYRCLDKIDPEDFNLNAESVTPKDLFNLLKELNTKQIL